MSCREALGPDPTDYIATSLTPLIHITAGGGGMEEEDEKRSRRRDISPRSNPGALAAREDCD